MNSKEFLEWCDDSYTKENIGNAWNAIHDAFTWSDHPLGNNFWSALTKHLDAIADSNLESFDRSLVNLRKALADEPIIKEVEIQVDNSPTANASLSEWRDWARKMTDVLAEAAKNQPPMSVERRLFGSISVDLEGFAYGIRRESVQKGGF